MHVSHPSLSNKIIKIFSVIDLSWVDFFEILIMKCRLYKLDLISYIKQLISFRSNKGSLIWMKFEMTVGWSSNLTIYI